MVIAIGVNYYVILSNKVKIYKKMTKLFRTKKL